VLELRIRIPPRVWIFVLCVLYNKDKSQRQDNQDKATEKKCRENKNITGGGQIFRNLPYKPWGPISFLYNGATGLFHKGKVAGAFL
jgi:hypothetical protein